MPHRLAVLLGTVALLGASATLSGCGGGGSSGSSYGSSANPYAKEIQPNPVIHRRVGIDPDQEAESSSDAWVTIRPLGKDSFQLTVINTSAIGFITDFSWSPPAGLLVTGVKGSSAGNCRLSGARIACTGAIRPPKCTCRPGGKMTIDFTATEKAAKPSVSYGVVHSYIEIDGMTPVPYKIPSYLGAKPPQADLPFCAAGQASTSAHPCTPKG